MDQIIALIREELARLAELARIAPTAEMREVLEFPVVNSQRFLEANDQHRQQQREFLSTEPEWTDAEAEEAERDFRETLANLSQCLLTIRAAVPPTETMQ